MTENSTEGKGTGGKQRVDCEVQVQVASGRNVVDAGTEMALRCAVACSSATERLGEIVEILDHDGVKVGRAELVRFDGELNESDDLLVRAPDVPGEYSWTAVLAGNEVEGLVCGEARVSFDFEVAAHATRIEVWDVPAAITSGEEFRIKVGIKCSAGCDQAGREFEVYDQQGMKLGSGAVGNEPWRGTTALYFAEVSLVAPEEVGRFSWEVRSSGAKVGVEHEPGVRSFGSNTVAAPDHLVTVIAMDRDKKAPIEGMHILLHPFRARTDAQGVAKLAVPKGDYSLLVSGFRYLPYRTSLSVGEDISVTAEVEWEPIPEKISG